MQGVTLGHLLHSMALAAGESTRIAVIDWSRKTRAGQTEVVGETEDLSQDITRDRIISEVTEANARVSAKLDKAGVFDLLDRGDVFPDLRLALSAAGISVE